MVKQIVQEYVHIIRKDWEDLLKRNGYSVVEEDLTSDGQWHGDYPDEFRDLGSVTFWKNVGLDGVVIKEVKFYSPSGNTMHGTGVNAIGEAYNYFKGLGYEQDFEHCRRIIVNGNGREIGSIKIHDSCKFYEFLKDLQKK